MQSIYVAGTAPGDAGMERWVPDTLCRGAAQGAGHLSMPQTRANTRLALVPPNPKLFDITVSSFASRLSRTME